jgi:hypothetical protein
MSTRRTPRTAPGKPTTSKPFVRYGRISRLNGREKGANVSIEEQARAIEAIAATHGLELFPEMISDEDVSGSGSCTRARPAGSSRST